MQNPDNNIDNAYNKVYKFLTKKYGPSAATTYWWLRFHNNQTASFSNKIMLLQFKELSYYQGGFDCTPFRKMREFTGLVGAKFHETLPQL